MTTNVAAGLRAMLVYRKDSSGYFQAGSGASAPSAGDQTGETPYRLYLAKNFPSARASGQVVTTTGDDTRGPSFKFGANENAQGNFTLAGDDPTADNIFQGTTQVTLADTSIALDVGGPGDFDPESVGVLIIRRSKTTAGVSKWETRIYYDVEIEPLGSDAQEQAAGVPQYGMSISPATFTPWGETILAATYGTASMDYFRVVDDYPLMLHRWTGDNSETVFNLPYTPVAAGLNVWVDGSLQALTTDYTITPGSDLITFQAGSIPGSNAIIVALYRFDSADLP